MWTTFRSPTRTLRTVLLLPFRARPPTRSSRAANCDCQRYAFLFSVAVPSHGLDAFDYEPPAEGTRNHDERCKNKGSVERAGLVHDPARNDRPDDPRNVGEAVLNADPASGRARAGKRLRNGPERGHDEEGCTEKEAHDDDAGISRRTPCESYCTADMRDHRHPLSDSVERMSRGNQSVAYPAREHRCGSGDDVDGGEEPRHLDEREAPLCDEPQRHPRENEIEAGELGKVSERGAPECSLRTDLAIRRRGRLLTRHRAPHTTPVKAPRDEPQQRSSAK